MKTLLPLLFIIFAAAAAYAAESSSRQSESGRPKASRVSVVTSEGKIHSGVLTRDDGKFPQGTLHGIPFPIDNNRFQQSVSANRA